MENVEKFAFERKDERDYEDRAVSESDIQNQIRKIIQRRLDTASDEYEDYLCFEKGVIRRLAKDFKPTVDDINMKNKIISDQIAEAKIEILELGKDVKPSLIKLSQSDFNPDIRNWAILLYE